MLEEALLAEQFETLLSHAKQAESMYESLASSVSDPSMRNEIEQLLRDKRRHVLMTQRLLEIVQ